MKRNFCKLFLSAALVLCGLGGMAQGLQGVIVESYHTTTQADADYYNGLGNGSGTMTAGLTTYRVYIDMAPDYKLNTVFGTSSNVLDITSTSVFWNDDGFGAQFPPQTSRLDDGSAFDSWITIGRASRSGGVAGCTSNLEQLGVPRVSDTNGNLTMCNLWSGFGPADNDGNVSGASADPTLVGISAANLAPFIDVDGGSAFSTTGSWALLPPLNGPEAVGANRVLIGQFTTAGTFSFKLNISLQTPQQTVEFYTHTSSESGSTVSALLTYPVACTPVQITSTSSNSPICSIQTLNLGVVATGTEPINYTWTGTGTISNGATANATVTGAATGNYNIAVSNGCGNVSQNVAVVVNTATNWYADTDGDGFGAGAATLACTAPGGTVANNTDLCPADPLKQAPGACGCGVADVAATYYADTDGDGFGAGAPIDGFTCNVLGVTNNTDLCPTDANKQAPGACGCGVADVAATYYADTDGDGFGAGAPIAGFTCISLGVTNNTDLCPTDANKQAPGACGCGVADVPQTYYADTDGDGFGAGAPIDGFTCTVLGVTNNTDLCPTDANKQAPGACGCGVADVPQTYYADTDGDGFGAGAPIDGFTCISLGVTNNTDNCPTLFGVIGSTCDDGNQNTNGDVINANCVCEGSTVDCNDNNPCTIDSFNGTICVNTPGPDGDGDGTCDLIDGCPNDANKITPGACGCGVADVPATYFADTDGDGFGAGAPIDGFTCTVLGVTNNTDLCPTDANKQAPGACGCGVADVPQTYYADTDGDGFGAGAPIDGFTCISLGVTNNTDNCPTSFGVIGSTCDDGNQNTNGDVINANCVCEGSTVDCNDNNPCTIDSFNGTICVNTPGPDGDGDGTCDLIDGCPNDANKIAPGACGCGVADVPATYYADTDGDGFGAGAPIAGFTCISLGVTNNTDNCPGIVGVIGSSCNDGNANTTGDVINANCQCVGTPIGGGCVLNQLELVVETDGTSAVTYEVRIQGSGAIALSGALPVAADTYTESLCLANGCYYLRVLDNGGDGIIGGGYVLSTLAGVRIIDDRDNFTTGSVSAIANNEGFCLPLGADKLVGTSCDKLDWVNGDYIVASANPAVSAQWLVGSQTDDGYEFWFFNPNGGYSFRKFRNHATSDGFGPASATRACHLKINNWVAAQQIPATTLMNVRIRSRVNGVNSAWGATCTFKIDPVRAACPLTKLNDIPGQPAFSCGATRAWGAGNYVYARPVSGATQYQFRFRKDNEGFVAIRTATTYFVQLNWITNPLQNGKTYQVEVRAFKNGAWCIDAPTPAAGPNFLPWGVACSLTIDNTPVNGGNQNSTIENTSAVELRMYPNPNRGDQLYVQLDAVEEGVNTVSVDIFDLTGQRVSARQIAVNDGFLNTVIDLDGDMSSGMYLVNITVGSQRFTERLAIQK